MTDRLTDRFENNSLIYGLKNGLTVRPTNILCGWCINLAMAMIESLMDLLTSRTTSSYRPDCGTIKVYGRLFNMHCSFCNNFCSWVQESIPTNSED